VKNFSAYRITNKDDKCD